jgi:DNA repair protein RecN (Recombination protein N)
MAIEADPSLRPGAHGLYNSAMLTRLALRDFAIAAALELEFGAGLTVISGETGAGKSLLVDALGFLGGQRADSGMVRHGAGRAELTAQFALADAAPALEWLQAEEFDDGDECVLRRTLRADGGSRAWINGRPATLAQLAELAALLFEIHGQHEQQALLSRPAQRELLDAYAGHDALVAKVRGHASRWRELAREHAALLARGDAAERREWLRHQLDELDAESLDPDSLAELDRGHRRQAHAAALIAACEDAGERLGGESSLPVQVQRLRSALQREATHEPRQGDVDAMLESASIQLDEAAALVERIRSDLDLDPEALAAMERRLARLQDLARKHRVPVDGLAAQRAVLAAEHDALGDAGQRLAALADALEGERRAWREAAGQLGASRRKAATALSGEASRLIGELGMAGGRFEAALECAPGDADPDPHGAERVEFLVAANAGQPPRPLRKVASGGELSRVSLAIEVAALGLDAVPTMVFDEVDSGIGGAVAQIVGRQLRALGGKRQVLCVTHLPQVAAQGHAHWRVSKAASAGVTQSEVQALDAKQRIGELARMLGGVEVGDEARAAAKKLLADAL